MLIGPRRFIKLSGIMACQIRTMRLVFRSHLECQVVRIKIMGQRVGILVRTTSHQRSRIGKFPVFWWVWPFDGLDVTISFWIGWIRSSVYLNVSYRRIQTTVASSNFFLCSHLKAEVLNRASRSSRCRLTIRDSRFWFSLKSSMSLIFWILFIYAFSILLFLVSVRLIVYRRIKVLIFILTMLHPGWRLEIAGGNISTVGWKSPFLWFLNEGMNQIPNGKIHIVLSLSLLLLLSLPSFTRRTTNMLFMTTFRPVRHTIRTQVPILLWFDVSFLQYQVTTSLCPCIDLIDMKTSIIPLWNMFVSWGIIYVYIYEHVNSLPSPAAAHDEEILSNPSYPISHIRYPISYIP